MPTTPGLFLIILFAALAVLARCGERFRGLSFTFVLLATASAAFTFPDAVTKWGEFEFKRTIAPFVQIILFGMGMTLTVRDFRRVLEMPRAIFIGSALQFAIMPVAGLLFARLFGLAPEIAAGLVLIGCCPGGVASNVIAFLARANVPLSVTMTAISTLLSPLLTPLAMKLLVGATVPIAFWPMFFSIIKMIILPLIAGLLIKHYLPRFAVMLARGVPYLAMLGICVIVGVTIGLSRDDLLAVGLVLLAAAACHNATGFLLGYYGARVSGLNVTDARTVALEVGIQNGGMATGLAFNVLHSAQAAMASAAFGPWSAMTSSALASWWRRQTPPPSTQP